MILLIVSTSALAKPKVVTPEQALQRIDQGERTLLGVNSRGNKAPDCPKAAESAPKTYDSLDDVFREELGQDRSKAPPIAATVPAPQYDQYGRDKDGFLKPTCEPKPDGELGAPVCSVSESTANMLFDKLRQAKDMLRLDHPRLDTCRERAQVASYRLLLNYGVTTGKIWVTDYRGMSPQLDGEKQRSGSWSYHVATYVMVNRNGKNVRLVLDPIVDRSRPLTEDEWKSRISSSPGSLSTTYAKACAYKLSEARGNCTGPGMFWNDAVKIMNGHETDLNRDNN